MTVDAIQPVTDSAEAMITELLRKGFSTSAIAARYDTSRSTVSRILAGTMRESDEIAGKLANMHQKGLDECRNNSVAVW